MHLFSSTGKNNYQNSQFAMETICVEERRNTAAQNVQEEKKIKIQGISFKTALWLQRGEVLGWTLTQNLTGKTKAQCSVGGVAWAERISGLPTEGALLYLDNCLQRSLDTSTQMPLPIKHSVACSFSPQQLLSDKGEKRNKYVCDDSRTPTPSQTPL